MTSIITIEELLLEKYTNFVNYLEATVIVSASPEIKDKFERTMKGASVSMIKAYISTEVIAYADSLPDYIEYLCTHYGCDDVQEDVMRKLKAYLLCFLDLVSNMA